MAQIWQDAVDAAKRRRDESLAKVSPPLAPIPARDKASSLSVMDVPATTLSQDEMALLSLAPETLISRLQSGELTSLELTRAYLRAAALAQLLVNCVTELLVDEAIERAKELDEYFQKNKKPIGRLHGFPISVKEHVGMKGKDANVGFVAWIGKVVDADAEVLSILKDEGAVFYVRTTNPTALFMSETYSNIFGNTVNPWNTKLTSGGSSGGDGALIALGAGGISVSTDLGGSIRIPAGNCGNYGFRPTTYRVPTQGMVGPGMGSEQILPVIGPQSSTMGGIKAFMSAVIGSRPWEKDRSLPPVPWRLPFENAGAKRESERLKIGVMWDDGIVRPAASVRIALKEIVEKLEKVDGVDIVEWKPWNHDHAQQILAKLYLPDGGNEITDILASSGEPTPPLLEWKMKSDLNVSYQHIDEVWHWTVEREQFRFGYAQEWNAAGLDVLLCPYAPSPAPPLQRSRYWGYTSIFNLLDYPALVFPVTRVSSETNITQNELDSEPRNDIDKYYQEMFAEEKFENAPVSIQLVGPRYEDENVIETFDYIKEKIGLPFDPALNREKE